ncbi:MAG TPA: type II secretion system F family protein [Candidatus Deferrimicrobiaceae bacterium]|jgi:type IV pilus assembly protein PilC
MPRYAYEAVDDYGKRVQGALMAADENALRNALAGMSLYLVKATERAGGGASSLFRKKIKRDDLIQFTFHFKTLIGAGIPLVSALGDLAEQTENPELRDVLQDIRRNLQSGATLSDSFALHPNVFPEIFGNILRAGETTGNLDSVLDDLTKFLTWQEELSGTIKQATYYPATLLSAVGMLIFVLFSFVFPRFLMIFKGANIELPAPTRVVIAISVFFRDYGVFLVVGVVAVIFAYRFYRKTEKGRLVTDRWKLKMPLMGHVIRAIEISQFCHYLASLFRAGVEMTHALWIVEKLVGNKVIAQVIHEAREDLMAGGSLSASLRKSGEFPPMVLRMVSAGESTGNLDGCLENVSEFYDREVPKLLKKTFAVMEPLIILVLAVVVLGAALAFFLALYKMVGSLSK